MTLVGFKDLDLLAPPLRNNFWPNIFFSLLCTESEDEIFEAISGAAGTDEDELLYSSYILLFSFSYP